MRFKKIIRFIHLWLGLASGLVVFVVATTGCIYNFEEEIREVIHKDVLKVNVSSLPVKSVEELLSIVKKEYPEQKIRSIRIPSDESSSVQINLKNKSSVYIDPYSGKILGMINPETEFLGIILKIHRTLYLGDTGKIITGISALIFFTMLISGIILWWPVNKRVLKHKFWIKRNAHRHKLNYDLHSVLGFYASLVIIFTVLTGIVWAFDWAEGGMYAITGSKKEIKNPHSVYSGKAQTGLADQIIMRSSVLSTNVKDRILFFPNDSTGAIRMNIRYKKGGFYTKQDQLFFDQYSGKLLAVQLFENSSKGDKLKATNYNIHTGKVLGLTGQLLVFFASLISASLPVTGFLLWRKRKRNETLISSGK